MLSAPAALLADSRSVQLEKLLTRLDSTIAARDHFHRSTLASIDSIREVSRQHPENAAFSYAEIARLFTGVNFDSMRHYYSLASDIFTRAGDLQRVALVDAYVCAGSPDLGDIHRSVELYNKAGTLISNPQLKTKYYKAGLIMFHRISEYFAGDSTKFTYDNELREVADSVVARSLTSRRDNLVRLALADLHRLNGENSLMVASLNDILDDSSPDERLYGIAAAMLADYYRSVGKTDEATYYLALASISNIRSPYSSCPSLTQLGLLLKEAGDDERAFKYLSTAVSNSISTGSCISALQSTQALPSVLDYFEQRKRLFIVCFIIMAVLLIAAVVFAVLSVRRARAAKRSINPVREQLSSNRDRELSNIISFLNLYWQTVERYDEFSKLSKRKLAAGQVEELYQILKSGSIIEEQSLLFFDAFDNSFLNTFPDFVSRVDALLRDDAKLTPPKEGRLTTELRILAFLRLGIDDSSRIARFLKLSVNTVYTYRNKMRGRAIDRELFESQVANISS